MRIGTYGARSSDYNDVTRRMLEAVAAAKSRRMHLNRCSRLLLGGSFLGNLVGLLLHHTLAAVSDALSELLLLPCVFGVTSSLSVSVPLNELEDQEEDDD